MTSGLRFSRTIPTHRSTRSTSSAPIRARVSARSARRRSRTVTTRSARTSRFTGATALGAVAAAIGCALWLLVTELTGYQIGLVAIVVGYIVGTAVHVGSRRMGGLAYQLLAVFLTYTAIVMTYVPIIANQLAASESSGGDAVLAWYAAVPFAYTVPFLMGFENIIGILIIGFALWQAFRMNARVKIEMQGPFRIQVRDPSLG